MGLDWSENSKVHHPLPFLIHVLKQNQSQFLEEKHRRALDQSSHFRTCNFSPLEYLGINAH